MHIRAAIAQAALNLAAPSVRIALIKDAEFRETYHLVGDSVISFGESGVSFQRSTLFDAIRVLLGPRKHIDVPDTEGRKWRVRKRIKKDGLPRLSMAHRKRRYRLPGFCGLASDRKVRLAGLAQSADEANLPKESVQKWRKVLAKRALHDDEIAEYHAELAETPIRVAENLRREVLNGESDLSSIVPRSPRYYQLLVGAYDGSETIQEYASGALKHHFKELIATNDNGGFLHSLLVVGHGVVTAEIPTERLDDEDLLRGYENLVERGDRLSQIGAIELGFRLLPTKPALAPLLEKLICQIRDDDPDAGQSQFNLLAALFVLVDGELSRTRIFSTAPPFYRRLASLAQAALIERQLITIGVNRDHFASWAFEHGAAQFYLQSFADMRLEPRWNPDFSAKDQLKADFVGRVLLAAHANRENLTSSSFKALLFESGEGSLLDPCDSYRPFFPGALEGAEIATNELPSVLAKSIDAQLDAPEVEPQSFVALVNAAMVFRLDRNHAEKAAEVLKIGDYRLSHVKTKAELVTVLNGLASVAAITRSGKLADDLRIIVRRYLKDPQFSLSVEEAIRVGAVAAASRRDAKEWREYIGEFLTEISFGDLSEHDVRVLDTYMRCLCRAVPELWVQLGRARAAVKSLGR